jgi:hypothetical protein
MGNFTSTQSLDELLSQALEYHKEDFFDTLQQILCQEQWPELSSVDKQALYRDPLSLPIVQRHYLCQDILSYPPMQYTEEDLFIPRDRSGLQLWAKIDTTFARTRWHPVSQIPLESLDNYFDTPENHFARFWKTKLISVEEGKKQNGVAQWVKDEWWSWRVLWRRSRSNCGDFLFSCF